VGVVAGARKADAVLMLEKFRQRAVCVRLTDLKKLLESGCDGWVVALFVGV
jgi:hypothetical protein